MQSNQDPSQDLLKNPLKEYSVILNKYAHDLPNIAQEIFNANYLKPYNPDKDKDNLYELPVERISHGATHVSRVAAYIPILINLLRTVDYPGIHELSDQQIFILTVVALLHDARRQSDGRDEWEEDSKNYCENYLVSQFGLSPEIARAYAQLIIDKEEGGLLGKLLQAADALDIMRVRSALDLSKIALYDDLARIPRGMKLFEKLAFEIRNLIAKQHDLKFDCSIQHKDKIIYPAISKTRDESRPELKQNYEHAICCYNTVTETFTTNRKDFPLLHTLYSHSLHPKHLLAHSQLQAKVMKELTDRNQAKKKKPVLGPYSQSQGYLKLLLKDEYDEKDIAANVKTFLKIQDQHFIKNLDKNNVCYNTLTNNETNGPVNQTLTTAIQAEVERPGDYVFYHAATAEIGFLYAVYSKFRNMLMQNHAIDITSLRQFDLLFYDILNVDVFVTKMDSTANEGTETRYNYRTGYQERAICANPFLMGNYTYTGSSSLCYWLQGYSERPPEFQKLLLEYFKKIGFSLKDAKLIVEKFVNFFNTVYTTSTASSESSSLLQIFIAPDAVDDMVYVSEVVGDPLRLKVEEDQTTYKPSRILPLIRQNPADFEKLLRANKGVYKNQGARKEFSTEDFLCATTTEARIYLKPDCMHDVDKVCIKSYWKDNKKRMEVDTQLDELVSDTVVQLLNVKVLPIPHTLFSKKPVVQVIDGSRVNDVDNQIGINSGLDQLLIDGAEEEGYDPDDKTWKKMPWRSLNLLIEQDPDILFKPFQFYGETTNILAFLLKHKAIDLVNKLCNKEILEKLWRTPWKFDKMIWKAAKYLDDSKVDLSLFRVLVSKAIKGDSAYPNDKSNYLTDKTYCDDLFKECMQESPHMVSLFLRHSTCCPDELSILCDVPLTTFAVYKNDIELLKLIVERSNTYRHSDDCSHLGSKGNHFKDLCCSALALAIKNSNIEMVKILLQHRSTSGTFSNSISVSEYWLRNALIEYYPPTAPKMKLLIPPYFYKAIVDPKTVKDEFDPDYYIQSPFMIALDKGEYEIMKLLLANKQLDINTLYDDGSMIGTALMFAAKKGDARAVALILSHPKVDINYMDSKGNTALSLACEHGRCDTVTVLLSNPEIKITNPSAKDLLSSFRSMTILESCVNIALTKNNFDVLARLITHKAFELDLTSSQHKNILTGVLKSGFKDEVKQCLQNYILNYRKSMKGVYSSYTQAFSFNVSRFLSSSTQDLQHQACEFLLKNWNNLHDPNFEKGLEQYKQYFLGDTVLGAIYNALKNEPQREEKKTFSF